METPPSARQNLEQDGIAILKGFYNVDTEILPILRSIREIIQICARKYGVQHSRGEFSSENFDDGYLDLLRKNRQIGSEIYDAVKQIPEFLALVSGKKNQDLVCSLRQTNLAGVVDRGFGIRIDNPRESEHLPSWHQDYLGHLRSLDGVVLWSPLRRITEELGPVEFCVGSNRKGLVPLYCPPENQRATNSTHYGNELRMVDENKVVGGFEKIKPLVDVGDLVLIDFRTIHRSSANQSLKSRWSMQFRWFNFREETGIKHGWPKSYAHGKSFVEVHPELFK